MFSDEVFKVSSVNTMHVYELVKTCVFFGRAGKWTTLGSDGSIWIN